MTKKEEFFKYIKDEKININAVHLDVFNNIFDELIDELTIKSLLPVVSHQRELLMAFEKWRRLQGFFANATATFKIVDEYLESH